MADLLIPGTIPGLLRRGAPVVVDVGGLPMKATYLHLSHGLVEYIGEHRLDGADPSEVALDLYEPEGCDRAARWVAEHFDRAHGITAPRWEYVGERRFYLGTGTGRGIYFVPTEGDDVFVPALANIDPSSPTRDAEGLIAVVLSLAEVST